MKIVIGIVIFCFVCLILVALESLRESLKVKAVKYKYPDFFLKHWKGTKILLLSDLHNCVYGRNNEKLLKLIKKQNPDIILIAGDMLVGKTDVDFSDTVYFLNELAKLNCKIYYAHGNHELRTKLYVEQYKDMYERFRKELSSDIKFLINESVTLKKEDETLKIFGLDLERKYYQRFKKVPMEEEYLIDLWLKDCKEKSKEEKMNKDKNSVLSEEISDPSQDRKDKKEFNILIAHNPLYFEEYAKQLGVDMVVSGHYHGCLVRLPFIGGVLSPQMGLFPKYVAGEYRIGKSIMYLSAGLGSHSIKIRIGNIPEVVVIEL